MLRNLFRSHVPSGLLRLAQSIQVKKLVHRQYATLITFSRLIMNNLVPYEKETYNFAADKFHAYDNFLMRDKLPIVCNIMVMLQL